MNKNYTFYNFKNYFAVRRLLLVVLFLSLKNGDAQPLVTFTPVITTNLNGPTQMVNAGDGSNRIFIIEKTGAIKVFDGSYTLLGTFMTVTGITTTGERGLLSMVFHPDYANNGLFFVYYTNAGGNLEVARYQVSSNPDVGDPNSKVVVLTIPHPNYSNHNGGEMHFGSDGYLYLSTGDGGGSGDSPNNAQNSTVLLGKLLRLNVNTSATAPFYTVPSGNPFNNEIFDLGLRNPFRWSFDKQTGDMWIGDVGQNLWEEIDFRPASALPGVNYGWRCFEGLVPYNSTACQGASAYLSPVFVYPTGSPYGSITGGIVYRGSAHPPLQGWYIAADFYTGEFFKIASNGSGGWLVGTQTVTPGGVVDFAETEDGELYMVSHTDNSVHRIGSPSTVGLDQSSGNLFSRVQTAVTPDKILYVTCIPDAAVKKVEVFGVTGALLMEKNNSAKTNHFSFSVDHLATGVYLLKVSGEENVIVKKIVIP